MKYSSYIILVCFLFVCVNVDISEERSSRRRSKCRKCGRINGDHPLIINGKYVTPKNKYPWVVRLELSPEPNLFEICGGAIISRRFILTAAHCVQGKPEQLKVVFLNGKEADVSKIIIHPGYNVSYGDHSDDIALVKMKKLIKCNKYRSRICLPSENYEVKPGSDVIVNGWGQTRFGPMDAEEGLPFLKEGVLTPVKDPRCQLKKTDDGQKMKSHCLFGKEGDTPCFGDSGGSAVSRIGNKYYTIGVASFITTDNICELDQSNVYTSVQAYLPWIIREAGLKLPKRYRPSQRAWHPFVITDAP